MSESHNREPRLSDWGEFRLLNEIVLPIVRSGSGGGEIGDDCAYVAMDGHASHLVVTTDVGPKPLVWELGHHSYWTWGWYSVLANASDLAAAGALTLAFTTSVEAPGEMSVSDFRDYFEGMDAACLAFGLRNAGGNIRVAPRFACHGTAMGVIPDACRITRNDCQANDYLVSIGKCGYFMSCYLKAQRLGSIGLLSESERSAILTPKPQLYAMNILRKYGILSSATDNSDGVLGSAWNIAERSNVAFEIDFTESNFPRYVVEEALLHSVDPRNLFLFWGDWQIIATVKKSCIQQFNKIIASEGIEASIIGNARTGPPALFGSEGGACRPLRLLRNENFVDRSFNENPVSHVDYLLKTPVYL
jgi:thiamine-monophosphate kinase